MCNFYGDLVGGKLSHNELIYGRFSSAFRYDYDRNQITRRLTELLQTLHQYNQKLRVQ
jgi:hypothetical protein